MKEEIDKLIEKYAKEIAMKFYDWTNTTHIDRLTHTEELFNMFLKDGL